MVDEPSIKLPNGGVDGGEEQTLAPPGTSEAPAGAADASDIEPALPRSVHASVDSVASSSTAVSGILVSRGPGLTSEGSRPEGRIERSAGVELPGSPDASINHPIVELRRVSKSFGQRRNGANFKVLDGLDLRIDSGERGAFVVLLGPSGCGKSTILSLISGLALPDGGQIFIHGKAVAGPSQFSATVPQSYTCFPWLTVLRNVELGLLLSGQPENKRRKTALEYLDKVGLSDRWDAYPKELSGGMQQRVAIARTLATKPDIVLMDEPFGALDAQTRADMQQMLLRLWEQEKNTIIFVTHDISEALLLGDRVILFSPRPARVVYQRVNLDNELGHERSPDILRDPTFVKLCEEFREKLKGEMAGESARPGDGSGRKGIVRRANQE